MKRLITADIEVIMTHLYRTLPQAGTPAERSFAPILRRVDGVATSNSLGEFSPGAYRTFEDGCPLDYLVVRKGPASVKAEHPLLVRIHSACWLGDLFGFDRCDCRWQLDHSMRLIGEEGRGILIYALGEEGRGHGLIAKMQAHLLMDEEQISCTEAYERLGMVADRRTFAGIVAILRDLDIVSVRLITNSPAKIDALRDGGIEVCEVVPAVIPTYAPHIAEYLRSKRTEMGHLIPE